jgi:hypothetical protein
MDCRLQTVTGYKMSNDSTTEFCNCCGSWIGSADVVVVIENDKAVGFCQDCWSLKTGRACAMPAGSMSGFIEKRYTGPLNDTGQAK